MSENEFGEFTVEVTAKPVGGVTEVEIPRALAELLAVHVPAVLASGDSELTLTARDPATARKLALYARAWGARQEPKLYIRKIPNRRGMPDTKARLSVEKDEDVPADSRPGRKK